MIGVIETADFPVATSNGAAESTPKPRMRKGEHALVRLLEWAESVNVAEELDEDKLRTIGARVVREYEIDERSRDEWRKKAERALDRAKLKRQPKSYPFEGASNVKYPLLTTAAFQFAAKAYPAIVEGQRVVKGQVIGDDKDGSKRSKADRISKHMSYQLINEMPEWEEDTDTLLHQLPIVGDVFRKVWYDRTLGRNRSEMVSAFDCVVNQKTRSLDTVPRITQCFELYPHEIEERQASSEYLDVDLGQAPSADGDEDEPHEFLEQHRYLDLDDDGYREPWVVTVHKETEKVVRLVANYDPAELKLKDDGKLARIARYNMFVKYPFFRDPAGGFYDLGFGELLESISEAIDSTVNQMLDAGHLQNAGGGFIGSGLSLKKSQMRFAPGQYHVVHATGAKIREAIYNMEHPGPSPVLFQLLGMMVEAGKEIANIKDILSGDMPKQNQTATTTLAVIEQGMKVYTSIYKRIYRALKKEFMLLFGLNARHLPEEHYFVVLDDRKAVKRSDYEIGTMDVVPVADPNIVTDMQRMARAEAYIQVAKDPVLGPLVNTREHLVRYYTALGVEDPEELLPEEPQGPSPMDQLQAEGMTAEVEQKKGEARKTGAEATVAEIDAQKKLARKDAEDFEREMQPQLDALLGNGQPKPEPVA